MWPVQMLNEFHLLQFPMVWCSLIFKGPGSGSWRKHMILRLGHDEPGISYCARN